jgi:predicted RNA-binding Zn-ribbon protein involved in translation (DUF1610 family)
VAERAKRSVIWRLPRDELAAAVRDATSFAAVLARFGLNPKGGNTRTLRSRLQVEGIRADHIRVGWTHRKGRPPTNSSPTPLADVMIEGSTFTRHLLRRRLIDQRVVPYVCALCGSPPTWRGNPLALSLNHINGVRTDLRKENLRFLCPNCDAQVHAAKRKGRPPQLGDGKP